jgi:hypothetical protein
MLKPFGLILIAIGIVGLLYGGVTWVRKDKVVDIGSVEITRDKHESLPLPPVVGAIMLVAGVAMVLKPSHG